MDQKEANNTTSPSSLDKVNDVSPAKSMLDDSTKDEALDFLRQFKQDNSTDLHYDAARARRLRRKVDNRIIPFFVFCYVLNFVDKTLLNVSPSHGCRTHCAFLTTHIV